MKNLPVIIAILAFLVPIGFVVVGNMGGADKQPVTGTLNYFYAPG